MPAGAAQTSYRLRPYEPGDLTFLQGMLYEATNWHSEEPRPPKVEVLSEPKPGRYLEGWGWTGDETVVAGERRQRTLVGGRLVPPHDLGRTRLWVRRRRYARGCPRRGTGVVRSWPGRGVAEGASGRGLSKGYGALSLSVQHGNPALRLYERNGFVKLFEAEGAWTKKADLSAAEE